MHRLILLILLLAIIVISSLLTPGCDTLVTEVNEITTAGHPFADFGIVGLDSGCVPCSAQFTDKSNGPRDKWTWFFGDGDSSFDTTPLHIYDSAGVYTVSLRIDHSPTEGTDTEVKKRFIICGSSIAGFTISDTLACDSSDITFTPIDVGGAISYRWNFGDGSTSNDTVSTHTYLKEGSYTVSLKVFGPCGNLTFTDSNAVNIVPCPVANFYPSIGFSFDGCSLPHTVEFTDRSIPIDSLDTLLVKSLDTLPAVVINKWLWDFGNGIGSNSNMPVTAIYQTAGKYPVKLVVTNDAGGVDSITKYVNAYNNPLPKIIAINPTENCYSISSQFVVKFDAGQSIGDTAWFWDFGDGTFSADSTDSVPAHAFLNPGSYDISLTVYGDCGESTLTEKSFVTLYDSLIFDTLPPDTIGFSANLTRICAGNEVIFSPYTSNAKSLSWNFGDGNTGSTFNHTYTNAGIYNVTLTIDNPCFAPISLKKDGFIVVIDTFDDSTLSIVAQPDTIPAGDSIFFVSNSTAVLVDSMLWDFGDGGAASIDPIWHKYSTVGDSIPVILTIMNECDTVSDTAYIFVQ